MNAGTERGLKPATTFSGLDNAISTVHMLLAVGHATRTWTCYVVAGFSPRSSSMGTQPHRLPRESYHGTVSASFTLCIAGRKQAFLDDVVVDVFISFLQQIAGKHEFFGIYCFMPDHLHLILLGINEQSDVLRGVEDFKQRSGYWLKHERPIFVWQKSFHDRVIRAGQLGVQVRYVLDNPVRKGLVREWRDYRFIGGIGMDLEAFLEGLGPD